jgi:MFS family permease
LSGETATGEPAGVADPEARNASDSRTLRGTDANSSAARANRFRVALMTRSSAFHDSLSGSPAFRFRILMMGSSVSMFGSRISTVAFPMLVLHLNKSPLITGLVAFAAIAPSMLVYIPAGALVDRWNPRRVMLISEFLRGLAIISVVASLAIFGRDVSIWWLITAMISEEILEIFSTLAERRYLSRLTESENLASRQAYVEVRTHAAVLAGRPIAPFLFTFNWLLPFAVDAMSFVFSVGIILMLRVSSEPVQASPKMDLRQMRADIGQGFRWLRDDRRASLTIVLMAVTSLISQALIMMFLTEAHRLELSTVAIAVVLAASGAGGAVGSICARFLPGRFKGEAWPLIQMLAWAAALLLLTMAGGPSPSCSAFVMLVLGFTGAIGNIEFGTYLISNVDDDKLARVSSISQMLAIGASALGPVVGGSAIQEYGAERATQILLCLVLLLACCSSFLVFAKVAARVRSTIALASLIVVLSTMIALAVFGGVLAKRGLATLQSVQMTGQLAATLFREKSPRRKQVFLTIPADSLEQEMVDH